MSQRDKRRRLGQNYLKDPAILYEMEHSINPVGFDKFVEIGPGMGALTQILNKESIQITAIDVDKENIDHLIKKFDGPAKFHFILGDILNNDLQFIEASKCRVVGNLPYNISTQIILKLINHAKQIVDIHFLVQKEVAMKINGSPGTKDWGKLAIKLSAFFSIEILFDVPPESFDIKPKVMSSFIRMSPLKDPLITMEERNNFFEIVNLSFMSRRKNIKNNLKSKEINWSNLDIDNKARPEDLTLESYIKITKEVFGN